MTAIVHAPENWIVDRLIYEYRVLAPDTVDFDEAFFCGATGAPLATVAQLSDSERHLIHAAIYGNSANVQLPQKFDFKKFSELTKSSVWLLMPWILEHMILKDNLHPKSYFCRILEQTHVVVTIHHIVPDKFTRKLKCFNFLDKYVNTYHVTNEKTKEYLSHITKKDIQVIPFWCNPEIWKALPNKIEAKKSMNIDPQKFTIGSFQRDTEGFDKASPKLEKGPDILCEIVEKLHRERDDIQLVLAAYNRQYVMNRLERTCPDLQIIYCERAPLHALVTLYNALDLYVVSSRVEGGPQAIIEAALTRCPIVSTNVGIATEILSPESIYSSAEDFHLASPNVEVAYQNAMKLAPRNGIYQKFKKMFSKP